MEARPLEEEFHDYTSATPWERYVSRRIRPPPPPPSCARNVSFKATYSRLPGLLSVIASVMLGSAG